MTPNENTRAFRIDLLMAGALVATGLIVSGAALSRHRAAPVEQATQTAPAALLAQATPPLQSTPGAASKPTAPDQSINSGARPHEIAPQPARPDSDAIDAGAKPALPRAPAEKIGEPIKPKG